MMVVVVLWTWDGLSSDSMSSSSSLSFDDDSNDVRDSFGISTGVRDSGAACVLL